MLGVFNLGGGEVVLVLAIGVMLFMRWLLGDDARDAGRSFDGISASERLKP